MYILHHCNQLHKFLPFQHKSVAFLEKLALEPVMAVDDKHIPHLKADPTLRWHNRNVLPRSIVEPLKITTLNNPLLLLLFLST